MNDKYTSAGYTKCHRCINPGSSTNKLWLSYQTQANLKKISTNDYDVGDSVDCLDGNTWRTAKVQDIRYDNNGVKELHITFDGWPSR